jgi:hypothetical protein
MAQVISITPELAKLSDFELFWECYPRKKAKLDALKAWQQTAGVRPAIEQIIAAIEDMVKEHDSRADPKYTYLPFPATWLRQGRFFDED